MSKNADAIIKQLNGRAGDNAIAAAAVSFSVDLLTQKLDGQVAAITEIDRSAQTIANAATGASQHVQSAVEAAATSREASAMGHQSLSSAVEDMRRIHTQTGAAMTQIEALDGKVQKIQSVTESISIIARQTNLLALNAAVEAARAGDQGRGFAVVADEVRKLASMTSDSTKEVTRIVGEILEETQRVVTQMQSLSEEVNKGTHDVREAGNQLTGITEQAATLQDNIQGFAATNQHSLEQLQTMAASLSQIRSGVSGSESELKSIRSDAERLMMIAEDTNGLLASASSDNYHHEFYAVAASTAESVGSALESAVDNRQVDMATLFSRNYESIPNTDPPKYSTGWDALCDQILTPIQEAAKAATGGAIFVITCDNNGYVPTHNQQFSQPLTGDYERDMAGNRTKRIFDDRTGARCGSHTQSMLLQTYKRDTGEIMHDMSVPVYVHGRHWGGVRVGYKPHGH